MRQLKKMSVIAVIGLMLALAVTAIAVPSKDAYALAGATVIALVSIGVAVLSLHDR